MGPTEDPTGTQATMPREGDGLAGHDGHIAAATTASGAAIDLTTPRERYAPHLHPDVPPVPGRPGPGTDERRIDVHAARRQPHIPRASGPQTICCEEGPIRENSIRRDSQVQTHARPI